MFTGVAKSAWMLSLGIHLYDILAKLLKLKVQGEVTPPTIHVFGDLHSNQLSPTVVI